MARHQADKHELNRTNRPGNVDPEAPSDRHTPHAPSAGGRIISGEGDTVFDQTAGGLIISGHGDEVPDQAAGGHIIQGTAEMLPDRQGRTAADREHETAAAHELAAEHEAAPVHEDVGGHDAFRGEGDAPR